MQNNESPRPRHEDAMTKLKSLREHRRRHKRAARAHRQLMRTHQPQNHHAHPDPQQGGRDGPHTGGGAEPGPAQPSRAHMPSVQQDAGSVLPRGSVASPALAALDDSAWTFDGLGSETAPVSGKTLQLTPPQPLPVFPTPLRPIAQSLGATYSDHQRLERRIKQLEQQLATRVRDFTGGLRHDEAVDSGSGNGSDSIDESDESTDDDDGAAAPGGEREVAGFTSIPGLLGAVSTVPSVVRERQDYPVPRTLNTNPPLSSAGVLVRAGQSAF
ncbi:uncharacterized protein B0I36DRAFT_387397 [Microdochium trichocladiopsis]|uniref:Uncharacterized protein n=1 Tax=Microdochium trichocladiopsis TaxID=1682393 RepID=A0A9P8XY80_9PEZI|nr:uncharacterized protein B0I36DRAFT_387397 [Microdochium trichocladiopsis]KAH7025008.1 hypothetical protein B0I36DRAFT_387397 [Microdochium trichocladiopsis]